MSTTKAAQSLYRQLVRTSRSPLSPLRRQVRSNQTSSQPNASSNVPSSSRIQRYLPRLQDLANRTGVPLSSLAVSFLILHELTAVLPVVGFYFLFSSLGTGLGIIEWLNRTTGEDEHGWRGMVTGWYDEGQAKIGRVGRRYGLWQEAEQDEDGVVSSRPANKAGEGVANAVAAYVVVKVRHAISQQGRTDHTGLAAREDRCFARRKSGFRQVGVRANTQHRQTLYPQ